MPLIGTRALTDSEFDALRSRLPEILEAVGPLFENFIEASGISSVVPGHFNYFSIFDGPSIVKRFLKVSTALTQLVSFSVSVRPTLFFN